MIPPIDVRVLAQAIPEPANPGWFSVRLALENIQQHDEDHECGVFGVSLTVELPEHSLGPLRLERVKRSYHLRGFMTMPAIGVNGGVEDIGTSGATRVLRTTWMPRYVLPRMQARRIPSVQTSYRMLADDTKDVTTLLALPDAMDQWRSAISANHQLADPGEDGTEADETAQGIRFHEDLRAWEAEARRVRKGCDIIIRARSCVG